MEKKLQKMYLISMHFTIYLYRKVMTSLLINLFNNLSEEILRIKCKF